MQPSTYKGKAPAPQAGSTVPAIRLTFATAAVAMVVLAYFWKALVVTTAIAPLVSGDPAREYGYPSLLDATVSELTAGLDKGDFSSVDLVNVSYRRVDWV